VEAGEMRLITVRYVEFGGTPEEWRLEDLTLGRVTLLVGKNASGKSRCLNIIGALSRYLIGERKPTLSAHYDVKFDHEGTTSRYVLEINESLVEKEQYWVGDALRLDRGARGEGEIWAEQVEGGKMLRFQTPQDEIATVARRDAIQHGFLQALYDWGSALRHYYFGTLLGKDRFAVFVEKGGAKFDERDNDAVVPLYKKAVKEFDQRFTDAVKADMERLEYPLDDVTIAAPVSVRFVGMPVELVGLTVKERELQGVTDQHSMSQGMFRSLSLIIQFNYAQMANRASCFLIDDVGEGLDFERSCRLIELLREKVRDSSVQLIMSTNDRFVMNRVPLEEWSVLQRQRNVVRVRNYQNSKEIFDEFKFTGLSNFDFLATDFLNEPVEENVAHE
jgi:predicted ATPase